MTTPARAIPRLGRKPLPPAVRIVLGLTLMVLVGTLLLMLPASASGERLSWNEALFTATSALTVTGLSTITPVTDLSLFGLWVLLLLIQLGGVGFMVVAVIFLLTIGRRIRLADRLALKDSLGVLSPAAIVRLAQQVLVTVLILEALGAAALYLHWRNDERLSESQALFYAIFHAVSAFCNAGFDLFTGTPGYPDGIPRDDLSLIMMGSLIFVGGLGIPVIGDFLGYYKERRLSLHTRITLSVVLFLIISGTVGFFVVEAGEGGTLVGVHPLRALLICLFQSVSARTAGFAGIAQFTELAPASQLLMITLMFIGCPPASMGGGITTGTFAALTIGFWSYARGLPTAQVGGRSLGLGTARKAAAVLTVSLFVTLLATWLLLVTHDTSLDAAAFEVVSAFATCGLTLGLTTELNIFGQLLICLVMFWGRLGALTLIVALAGQQGRQQAIKYPEEEILIG
jgi:trk system potassium uptake protein TrkH